MEDLSAEVHTLVVDQAGAGRVGVLVTTETIIQVGAAIDLITIETVDVAWAPWVEFSRGLR